MEKNKKTRAPKKVARKVTQVLSHAKESLKLLETLSSQKTRQAGSSIMSGVRKLTPTFSPEQARNEELITLRTEFAALRERVDELELQLASLLGQSRREAAFAKSTTAEALPRS